MSKTCWVFRDTETALSEAADYVTQTYGRLDAHGRVTQGGSDLPRLGDLCWRSGRYLVTMAEL
jgi:hypothetical protein